MVEWLHGPHISTGDMLRAHVAAGDSIGLEVEKIMQSGKLVPDELVNRMVDYRLANPESRKGVILDGYPRTVAQAQALLPLIEEHGLRPIVVHLLVDNDRIVARLSGRRQCPVCGTLYSLTTNPPRVPGLCDLDGTPLIARDDDSEPVVRERLREYAARTEPLLRYFRESGVPMVELDGADAGPEVINQDICHSLQKAGFWK
jgi:adenylate kinase